MFAFAAILDFICVVYETLTEITFFFPKTDQNRTNHEKSRTVMTLVNSEYCTELSYEILVKQDVL